MPQGGFPELQPSPKQQEVGSRPAVLFWSWLHTTAGFPGGSDGKESACNVGDLGLIPGLGRSLGEGNGNPLQYSCLENSMDREIWQASVCGVEESNMTE